MSVHRTLRAFVAAQTKVGTKPSIAEVAKELDVSPTTARARLQEAVDNGILNHTPGQQRAYSLSDLGKKIALAS